MYFFVFYGNNKDMKKILFTGARSGIASSTIEKILNDDFYIYVTVHTIEEEKSVKEKYSSYKNVECFKLDVTNNSDRDRLKDIDIDIIVLNAAIGYGGSLIELPIYKMRENYEVNVFANLEIIQIVIKNMIRKKTGKIIVMSSVAGILPIEFLGSYCSSKSSLIMISKVLRKELSLLDCNIKIKLIEPGVYKTGFNEVMMENKKLFLDYFKSEKDLIKFKEYIMFDLLGKSDLDSISKKIVTAIKSRSNRFIYSAPISQKVFVKLYQMIFG